jgi:hypothetical protein
LHAVEASAGHLPAHGIQPADLGDDVTAQGRVAAADHVDRRLQPVGQFEQYPSDRVFSSTASASGRLRVLVRMKHVEPAAGSAAAISSGSNTVTTSTSCTV